MRLQRWKQIEKTRQEIFDIVDLHNCRIDCTKLSSHSTLFVATAFYSLNRFMVVAAAAAAADKVHRTLLVECDAIFACTAIPMDHTKYNRNSINFSLHPWRTHHDICDQSANCFCVILYDALHWRHATPSSVNFSTLISYGFGMAVWNATTLSTQVSTESIHMRPAETQVCDIHIVTLVHCNFRRQRNRVPCPYARAIYATQWAMRHHSISLFSLLRTIFVLCTREFGICDISQCVCAVCSVLFDVCDADVCERKGKRREK